MTQKFGAAMWDERYAGEAFAYGLAPNAYLASQRSRLRPGMTALVRFLTSGLSAGNAASP